MTTDLTVLAPLVDKAALANVSLVDIDLQVSCIEVTDQATYDAADAVLGGIMKLRKVVDAERDKRYQALKLVEGYMLDEPRAMLKSLDGFIDTIKKTHLLPYIKEQNRIAQERQAAADKLAREEKERLEKLAAKTAKKDPEKAAVMAATAAVITPATIAPTFTQAAGSGTRKSWGAMLDPEMTPDQAKLALVQFVAAHPDYLNLLDINMTNAGRTAKMQEASMNIPGLKATENETLAKRT